MNTNEILKSLAELQKSLAEIESAKQQVLLVLDSTSSFANAASACQTTFQGLAANVTQMVDKINELSLGTLTDLEKQIKSLKEESLKINELNQNFNALSKNLEMMQAKADERHKEITERFIKLEDEFQQLSHKLDSGFLDIFRKHFKLPSWPKKQ